jgi:plastocyanin
VGLLTAACGGDEGSTTTAAEQPTTTGATTTGPVGGPGETVALQISGFAFRPDTITVLAGTTVEWTNADNTDHTVSADDGSFNQTVPGSTTFQVQMDTPGTFGYVCQIHMGMTGEVVVVSG